MAALYRRFAYAFFFPIILFSAVHLFLMQQQAIEANGANATLKSNNFKKPGPADQKTLTSKLGGKNEISVSKLGHNKLPEPVLVLSLPKSGTTSTQRFFNCAQKRSASHHWSDVNGKLVRHGACLGRNHDDGRPLLQGCGGFVVWTDMGAVYSDVDVTTGKSKQRCFFPSVHGLDDIARDYPHATIMQTVRNSSEWFESISMWRSGSLIQSLAESCGSPFPSSLEKKDWVAFYEAHTLRIRQFAETNKMSYVEVALEAPSTPYDMEHRTGISGMCWGNCIPDARLKKRCMYQLRNETWDKAKMPVVHHTSAGAGTKHSE